MLKYVWKNVNIMLKYVWIFADLLFLHLKFNSSCIEFVTNQYQNFILLINLLRIKFKLNFVFLRVLVSLWQ
jgi:hypothetical protein